MKKLSKMVFVDRPELHDKWWHRLAKVLVYGSTLCLGVFLIVSFSSMSWRKPFFTAYSFESGYSLAEGTPVTCQFTSVDRVGRPLGYDTGGLGLRGILSQIYLSPTVNCGDLRNSWAFLTRYVEAQPNYRGLRLSSGDLLKNGISTGGESDVILNEGIKNGDFKGVAVKQSSSFMWGLAAQRALAFLAVLLMWWFFWESVMYRTIVYIIFGKKKS